MFKKFVKLSSLKKGDKFSFVSSPSTSFTFVKYDCEIDSVVFQNSKGSLNLCQFNYDDDVILYTDVPNVKVDDVTFNACFLREKSVIAEISKTLRLIEKTENVTIPPFTLSRYYCPIVFANADSVTIHNLEDSVLITITSPNLKKPYSLSRCKKSNLHKNSNY